MSDRGPDSDHRTVPAHLYGPPPHIGYCWSSRDEGHDDRNVDHVRRRDLQGVELADHRTEDAVT